MKASNLILSCFLWFVAAKGFSQNFTVNIKMDNVSLEQLFAEIEKQTDVNFLYRNEIVAGKRATIHAEKVAVSVVLDEALKSNGLQYTMMDNNLIVISPAVRAAAPVLQAQQLITGRITDAEDGLPVPGASIFIANTTVGTASDASGNYSLTVPGRGGFEIVISHVGYQSVFHKIETPQSSHQYDVALTINELQEITITANIRYRRSDVNLFWRTILGEKPSRNGMEVLNPEKVSYHLNSNNVLRVSCKEPIEIINHQMGYHIRYILQSFQYDYRDRVYTYYGKPHFEELIPRNSRQKDRWEKKRQEVYDFSFNRFLRALYRKQIQDDGFLLLEKDSLLRGKISPAIIEDILQITQDSARLTIGEPLVLICYAKPVTDQVIPKNFVEFTIKDPKYPMVEFLPQQITLYSDGTYAGELKIIEHPKSIIGLSSKVPVEYGELNN